MPRIPTWRTYQLSEQDVRLWQDRRSDSLLDGALRYIDTKIAEAKSQLADIDQAMAMAESLRADCERQIRWYEEERAAIVKEAADARRLAMIPTGKLIS